MKVPPQIKAFVAGFTLGILIFVALNYFSYLHNVCPPTIDDCGWSFGFPMHLYLEGGFFTFKEIIWLGLVIDILFAFGLSLLLGFLSYFLWSRRNIRP
jgi:ABC-type antimicrobial peptide transport system permease subunit